MLSAKNVSRGSLCFKKGLPLLAGEAHRGRRLLVLEITGILVPMQAVYVQKLPGERMFRHGIQYSCKSKPEPDILVSRERRNAHLFLAMSWRFHFGCAARED